MDHYRQPFAGLVVLDFGFHPGSALASMVMGDFGAHVTCVLSGHELRDHPAAPMFLRGKRVLAEAAGPAFDAALQASDVAITLKCPSG